MQPEVELGLDGLVGDAWVAWWSWSERSSLAPISRAVNVWAGWGWWWLVRWVGEVGAQVAVVVELSGAAPAAE